MLYPIFTVFTPTLYYYTVHETVTTDEQVTSDYLFNIWYQLIFQGFNIVVDVVIAAVFNAPVGYAVAAMGMWLYSGAYESLSITYATGCQYYGCDPISKYYGYYK